MLVLSRKPNQRVLFPSLGVAIEVLKVNGRVARLGISAPRDLRILREELADQQVNLEDEICWSVLPQPLRHAIRNRLNTVMLGMSLMQRKLDVGQWDDIEPTLLKVFRELESIDSEISGSCADQCQDFGALPARRALLVDDSRNESELLADYLRTFDYEIDTAYDGLEAIEYLEGHEKPDVVLLDMQMPRLDGVGTIRRIRENPALDGIRVFAVSGLTSEEAGVEIGPQGVDRWFTKPIRPSELIEEIRRELNMLSDA